MLLKQLLPIFSRKIKGFFLISILFLLFLALFFIIKTIFSIAIIEIYGTRDLKGLKNIQGKIIFFLSSYQLERQLIAVNPKIKSLQITKISPNKLQIKAVSYSPVAIFSVDGGYFFLSEDGKIIEKKKRKDEKLPLINYYQKFHFQEHPIGGKLNYKEILTSLYFLEKLNYLGIKIETVDIKSLDMLIFNYQDKKIFFTTNKKKEEQYDAFKILIKRFKIEKIEYESIDLRFDKPIIKFK